METGIFCCRFITIIWIISESTVDRKKLWYFQLISLRWGEIRSSSFHLPAYISLKRLTRNLTRLQFSKVISPFLVCCQASECVEGQETAFGVWTGTGKMGMADIESCWLVAPKVKSGKQANPRSVLNNISERMDGTFYTLTETEVQQ